MHNLIYLNKKQFKRIALKQCLILEAREEPPNSNFYTTECGIPGQKSKGYCEP